MFRHERLVLLFQAAIQNIKNWRIFASQITDARQLGRRDMIVLYEVVTESVKKLNDVPSIIGLVTALQERLLRTQELDQSGWFYLWHLITTSASVSLTEAEIAQWSGEYVAGLKHAQLIDEVPDLPTEDLRQRLELYVGDLAKAEGSTQFTDDDLNPMSANQVNLRTKVINFMPSGVSFIDKYIGGFAGRETYSFIGPTGAAKTMIGVQVAISFAERLSNQYLYNYRKRPLGKVFYATTEDGMAKIFNRMVSCAGKIPLAKLSGKDSTPKTTAAAPSGRDIEICNEWFDGVISGEIERENNAHRLINQCIRIIDLTNRKIRGVAEDPIEVIRVMIDKSLESDKQKGLRTYCALIVIDHTADIIFDKLAADKSKNTNLWTATQNVPFKIRDTLTYGYDCPVWVIHQANGEGNRKKANQTLNHTNAMGSGSWAMHFDAAFNSTAIEEETMTAILTCTKARENKKTFPTYLKLVGDIGTMIENGEALQAETKETKPRDTWTGKRKKFQKTEKAPLVADV